MNNKSMCVKCAYKHTKKSSYGFCKVFSKQPKECWSFATEREKKEREEAIKEYEIKREGN